MTSFSVNGNDVVFGGAGDDRLYERTATTRLWARRGMTSFRRPGADILLVYDGNDTSRRRGNGTLIAARAMITRWRGGNDVYCGRRQGLLLGGAATMYCLTEQDLTRS
jgi:hypothetical protein